MEDCRGDLIVEKKYKYIAVAIVVALAAWYVFGGNGPTGQSGFDAVKTAIHSIISKQRAVSNQLEQIGSGIDTSSGTADDIGKSNSAAKKSINSAKTTIEGSRELIEDNRKRLTECQSIIDRMEERTRQGNGKTEAEK